jgi:histidinol-phosphate aminotransferase
VSTLRRSSLGEGFGYTPGEQPTGDGWLKLNTNEAPGGPSSAVAPAVAAAAPQLHRYPDPYGEPLRSALARHHGVETASVFVANGADQVIDCLFRAYCEPGDRVVWPVPTYSLFPVLATLFGAETVEVPLDAELHLTAAVATARGELRFVVNPNAPTGVWTPPDALEELLDPAPGVVAIDEAYCDFAPASCIPLLARHPRWLVLRTFSKSYALAGLRVGYAVGHPELIADLLAVKDSYPIDRCAIAGAAAALADQEHHRRLVEGVRAERGRLSRWLADAGWQVTPSEANFVFARPPGGEAVAVLDRLREQRILVRHFAGDHADRLRITVGTPAENDRLLAGLGLRP